MTEWEKRQKLVEEDIARFDEQISALELEAEQTIRKIKYLESETAIKYMEEDLLKIEQRIKQMKANRDKKATQNPVNMSQIMNRVKYFLENLDKILVKQIDPVKRAQFFGVFFERIPTYEEIKTGTENKALIPGTAELFKLGDPSYHILVGPAEENWNCIFECLQVLCDRLDDLDIEGMIEVSNAGSFEVRMKFMA